MRALIRVFLLTAILLGLPMMASTAVTIGTPKQDTEYGTAASIGVVGSSTSANVVKIRIRFVKGTKVEQETIVSVVNNSYGGTLTPPPLTGWPTSSASIQSRGLDKDGNEVTMEFDEVIIKVK